MDRKSKKLLLEIPVKKGDQSIKAYSEGDILMLHIWKSGCFIGKYMIDRTGKYISFEDGAEYHKSIEKLTESYYGNWTVKPDKESEDLIREFFKENGCSMRIIARHEAVYNMEKRLRAYDRKEERINRLMGLFDDQKEEIVDWYYEEIRQQEYAFKTGKGYACTACGLIHEGKYKNGARFMCNGKKVTVLTRKKYCKCKDFVTSFCILPNGERTQRFYCIETKWTAGIKQTEIKENIRLLWSGFKVKIYYRHYGEDWWDTNPQNRRWRPSYLYPKDAEKTLRNSVYQDTEIWKACKACLPINLILYYNTPVFTYLVSSGFKRFAEEIEYHDINPEAKDRRQLFRLDSNRIGRLKQLQGGKVIYEWLKWETKNEARISTQILKELDLKNVSPHDLGKLIEHMSPCKCINFLEKNNAYKRMHIRQVVEMYDDYISMAEKLGHDINDEIVYNPRNLRERHDQMVRESEKQKAQIREIELQEKYPGVNSVLSRIQGLYDYEGQGWQVKTPKSIKDIVEDAYQLHHCAGASERYYERIQDEETYILFLRKEPDVPWYTLEVEPGGTVRQKRSQYNRQPEIEAVEGYLREWQKEVRKRIKANDLDKAKKSASKRAEQMEELKNGTDHNRQLYETLMLDLMEAAI